MTVRRTIFVAVLLAAPLAACNAPSPGAVVPGAPPAPPPSASVAPTGSGCAAIVAKYRAVVENDIAMGNVNPKVYDQIRGEINEADTVCASGQDAQAVNLVRASKTKHGYPG